MTENKGTPSYLFITVEDEIYPVVTEYFTEQRTLESVIDYLLSSSAEIQAQLLLVMEYQLELGFYLMTQPIREIHATKQEMVDGYVSPMQGESYIKMYKEDVGVRRIMLQLAVNFLSEVTELDLNPDVDFSLSTYLTLEEYRQMYGIPPLEVQFKSDELNDNIEGTEF